MPHLRTSTVPQQVAEHLRKELCLRRWEGQMPGRDLLAEELGVSPRSVQEALKILEKEGVLVPQGPGRRSRIVLPKGQGPPAMRVALLAFDAASRGDEYMIDLLPRLEGAGHLPFFPDKTLQDLGMGPRRVARLVQRTEADAWLVVAGSRKVLEWFSKQEKPSFALAGLRRGLPIAGAGPDKTPAYGEVVRHLLALGHRRVSLLCRRQLRLPKLGECPQVLLRELEAAGVTVGEFNLPDWEESREGFERELDSLFGRTSPTALILDEPIFFHAAYHYLAGRGLHVPRDVSLVCADPDPGFVWCKPSVAHIRWDYRPVVRRVVRWVDKVAHGKDDRRQSFTKAEFVDGGTVGKVPRG